MKISPNLEYIGQTRCQLPPREPLRGVVGIRGYSYSEHITGHIYQGQSRNRLTITSAYASLFADEQTGAVAITYFLKELEGSLIPVDLWQSGGNDAYWDAILNWPKDSAPPLSLLVNPISGPEEDLKFQKHPIVKILNETGNKKMKGKIANRLYTFNFLEKISHLDRQGGINWSYFNSTQRLKEKIDRKHLDATDLLSFAQGICELSKPRHSQYAESRAYW